eukprot:TRINITY_DN1741_c1_g1_i1.p1 TRINITY_DN1741_c1_g1~~TRINITY_DN1741_c1_g1_i1.p1  ORF type:complete len:207 (-),score=32.95 TRINITY_DN1741_c1_g1_i1:34-654(-)
MQASPAYFIDPSKAQSMFYDTFTKKKERCPTLVACLNIEPSPNLIKAFEDYRLTLGQYGDLEELLFHGTTVKCDIVKAKKLCDSKDCSVCSISKVGFKMDKTGTVHKWTRFGHGIYLATNSSKSHEYTVGSYDVRTLLLCKVLPGHKYETYVNMSDLVEAPKGFHSVQGKVGSALNYEETVVYNDQCILPLAVLVYELEGVARLIR